MGATISWILFTIIKSISCSKINCCQHKWQWGPNQNITQWQNKSNKLDNSNLKDLAWSAKIHINFLSSQPSQVKKKENIKFLFQINQTMISLIWPSKTRFKLSSCSLYPQKDFPDRANKAIPQSLARLEHCLCNSLSPADFNLVGSWYGSLRVDIGQFCF